MSIEKYINDRLKGYHVQIMLYPSGGMLDATGCEECGANEDVFETVLFGAKKKAKTLEEAIDLIASKLNPPTKQQ